MTTIKEMCIRAKLDRSVFNTLRFAGHTTSWGDVRSEKFAIRLGLFSALKATGFLTPAAVDCAERLSNLDVLPKWYARRLSNGENLFYDNGDQTTEALNDCLSGVEMAFVVINLHAVRDRMLGLFPNITK